MQSDKCNFCKEISTRVPVVTGGIKKFFNESGRLWVGLRCPSCVTKQNNERYKLTRIGKKLDDRHVRARKAELFASKFFERSGYAVETANGRQGPDIVITQNNTSFTCEVKLLSKTGKAYRCFKVLNKRKKDDFIFLVFPDMKNFIFMPMVEFISCYQKGRRHDVIFYNPTVIPKNRSFPQSRRKWLVDQYKSGVSANKLSNITGKNIRTIYRALNYNPKRLVEMDGVDYCAKHPKEWVDPHKKCDYEPSK